MASSVDCEKKLFNLEIAQGSGFDLNTEPLLPAENDGLPTAAGESNEEAGSSETVLKGSDGGITGGGDKIPKEELDAAMDKLPIELAHDEMLVSLDGELDDGESNGGNSQDVEKREPAAQTLEEVATVTGEVIKLKKPDGEVKARRRSVSPSQQTEEPSFPCSLCSQKFSRKLYLNNHMEEHHGVKYVFTERGRKVKLVRVSKNYDPQNEGNLDPSLRKLIRKSAGKDLTKIVGVVSCSDPDCEEEVVPIPLTAPSTENGENEEGKGNEGAVEVGFLVDKINTKPYLKAIERGEVPFCAFSPISTDELFLLRIQDCSDTTRHMLVPADKDEVFKTPGAVKAEAGTSESGNEDVLNYKVAIVAVARQMYNEEQKQLLVSVDPLLKKDRKRISCIRFLSLDKFADFAFAGFDGNVSEFAKKSKNEEKASFNNHDHSRNQNDDSLLTPSSSVPPKDRDRSPIRVPSRRGRGGRRGGRGRKPAASSSRSSPPPARRGHRGRGGGGSAGDRHGSSAHSQHQQQMFPSSTYQPTAGPSFAQNDGFVKMENFDPQFFADLQLPMNESLGQYTDDNLNMFLHIPLSVSDVPMPFQEVTLGQTGTEKDAPPPNHDIFTIAIDQLLTLTGDPEADTGRYGGASQSAHTKGTDNQQAHSERGASSGARGGRRPGRKPGRKSGGISERNGQDVEETSNSAFSIMGTDIGVKANTKPNPKRRGRPPKNKVVMQASGQENENPSTVDTNAEILEKRLKLAVF